LRLDQLIARGRIRNYLEHVFGGVRMNIEAIGGTPVTEFRRLATNQTYIAADVEIDSVRDPLWIAKAIQARWEA